MCHSDVSFRCVIQMCHSNVSYTASVYTVSTRIWHEATWLASRMVHIWQMHGSSSRGVGKLKINLRFSKYRPHIWRHLACACVFIAHRALIHMRKKHSQPSYWLDFAYFPNCHTCPLYTSYFAAPSNTFISDERVTFHMCTNQICYHIGVSHDLLVCDGQLWLVSFLVIYGEPPNIWY